MGPVHFHRTHADLQIVGDDLVEFALQDQIHDLSLPGGQGIETGLH